MVRVRCQTTCGKRFVDFDASSYFSVVNYDRILLMADYDFNNAFVVDEVVYYCYEFTPNLYRFLLAIESLCNTPKATSFTTIVDKPSLFNWLLHHRQPEYIQLVDAGIIPPASAHSSKLEATL